MRRVAFSRSPMARNFRALRALVRHARRHPHDHRPSRLSRHRHPDGAGEHLSAAAVRSDHGRGSTLDGEWRNAVLAAADCGHAGHAGRQLHVVLDRGAGWIRAAWADCRPLGALADARVGGCRTRGALLPQTRPMGGVRAARDAGDADDDLASRRSRADERVALPRFHRRRSSDLERAADCGHRMDRETLRRGAGVAGASL